MDNKKVLIITPFFAPESHAAVFRAHKLVKYLNKYGWCPVVLTVDTNYTYNENKNLLDELQDIKIFRAKYVEPTYRGIKMAMGGEDRTFKTLKAKGFYDKNIKTNNANKSKSKIRRSFIQWFQEDILHVVDRYWTWKNNAILLGKKIINDENINLIFCTCPGLTQGEVAVELKKYSGLPLVADFRDPITTVLRNHSENDKVYFHQRSVKRMIFDTADIVTTASYSHKLILHDIYNGRDYDKIKFIPTGIDEEYIIKLEKYSGIKFSENVIVYTGEYLVENGFEFFELFAELVKRDFENIKKFKIKIIGHITINKSLLLPIISKLKIDGYIEFIDHIPQTELYKEIMTSKACLLQSEGRWWCSFAKMIDYIALEKPVLCFAPAISEANTMLRKAGLLIEFTDDFDNNIKVLEKFVEGKYKLEINKEFVNRYKSYNQVKKFASAFDHAINTRNAINK